MLQIFAIHFILFFSAAITADANILNAPATSSSIHTFCSCDECPTSLILSQRYKVYNEYPTFGSRTAGNGVGGYYSYPYGERNSNWGKSEKASSIFPTEVQYDKRTLKDFTTRDSRLGFIRKVYSIFGAQTITTILITAFIMKNINLRYFLQSNFQGISAAASLGQYIHNT